jgi:hypothetical protein
MEDRMPRRWNARTWTAAIVALLAVISVSSRHEPRTPIVTIEEAAQ